MSFLLLIVNTLVICIIGAEIIATAMGMSSADQLLVSSILSGLLTLMSFKLSKDALAQINHAADPLGKHEVVED